MRRFWELLALTVLFVAGVSCGKQNSANNEVTADTLEQTEDSIGTKEALNDIRFKGWDREKWLDNDYIRSLRDYLDDFNEGKVEDEELAPYKDKIKCKFIIYSIVPHILGGTFIRITFLDLPDRVFCSWVYSYVDEDTKTITGYDVRYVSIEDERTDFTREELLQAHEEMPELKWW